MEQDELVFPIEEDNQADMGDPKGENFLYGLRIRGNFWWGTKQMFSGDPCHSVNSCVFLPGRRPCVNAVWAGGERPFRPGGLSLRHTPS